MNLLTVKATINAPIEKVWDYWTNEDHVKNWNFASADWYCPEAKNNLEVGGEFHYTMSARDHSMSFDFWGTYQIIEPQKLLEIIIGDGRIMRVIFLQNETGTSVTEEFEPETLNPLELQQEGWQSILDNFKRYVEKI